MVFTARRSALRQLFVGLGSASAEDARHGSVDGFGTASRPRSARPGRCPRRSTPCSPRSPKRSNETVRAPALAAFAHALCNATISFADASPEQRFSDALACVREHDPAIDAADLRAMYTRDCKHGERVWQLRGFELPDRGLPNMITLIEARDGR
jgi:hypothetical protein